jgi:histidinol phosphatase-like PHP family hydrolase
VKNKFEPIFLTNAYAAWSKMARVTLTLFLRGTRRFAKPEMVIAFIWLFLITIFAATTSFKGIAPIDARTNQVLTDATAHFEFSFLAIAIEPFLSAALIIARAPDYRLSAVAALCWLIAATSIIHFFFHSQGKNEKKISLRILKSWKVSLVASLVLTLYLSFILLIPIPHSSLVIADRGTIAADLHSHTWLSRDGIASCSGNLGYHRNLGYSVVAITEHFSDVWRSIPPCLAVPSHEGPDTIQGVELSINDFVKVKGYLLVLGAPANLNLPFYLLTQHGGRSEEQFREFIVSVHNVGGAVLVLSYRLHKDDVERFSNAGVDGFEISNFGHPSITDDLREALLKAQRSHQIALVANSDWHGWSGFGRTWTLIKSINATSPRPKSLQVIDALRTRDTKRIIPVVSHVVSAPSLTRAIFAPFIDAIGYARELSPSRLISWWCWTFVLVGLALYLKGIGCEPGRCIMSGLLVTLSAGMLARGVGLISNGLSGIPFPFPLEIGVYSCCLGVVSLLLASAFLVRFELFRCKNTHRGLPD